MKRIGFFGGTFDPPHVGHLTLAKTARDALGLDEVLWVLTPQSPLKTTVFSSLEQRIAMVNLYVRGEPGFSLSRIDIDRDAPYYTVDTARLIREAYPEPIELYFIMGGDSLRNLVKWYHASELIFNRLDGMIVARRPGDDLDMDGLEKAMAGISDHTCFIDMPVMAVSSYNIRQNLAMDKKVDDDLKVDVLKYIQMQGLYRTEK